MEKLSKYIIDNEMNLLTCSILIGEVEKHIKNDMSSIASEINKVMKMKELGEYTLYDCISEISMMQENDRRWFDKHAIRCSECGEFMGFSDIGNYHTYDGQPICEECCTTNDNGFICP